MSDYRDAVSALRTAATKLNSMEVERQRLATEVARLEEMLASWHPDPPAPDPEPPLEPDPGEDPIVVEPPTGSAIAPDFSGLRCGPLIDTSSFPSYMKPTEADCDWILTNGVARSMRGLDDIEYLGGSVAGLAYRASRAALQGDQRPVVMGIRGDGGKAVVGGQWSAIAAHSVNDASGQGDARAVFVGLDSEASIRLGWSNSYGYAARLEAHDLIIQGEDDSFVMRCTSDAGTVIFDGCTLRSRPGMRHASGRHLGNFETLVIRRERFSGALFQEHWGYFKSARGGGIWLLENDMLGGNRTCFQIRPGVDEDNMYDAPEGQVVVDGNVATGYGFTHGNDPSTAGGGGAISVWSAPSDNVFVTRNTITDARYGCLMMSGQPSSPFSGHLGEDRNWYGPTGYPILAAHIEGNELGNHRGDRDCVSLSSVGEVNLYPNTYQVGNRGIVLDAPWALERACPSRPTSKRNGQVRFHGGAPTTRVRIGVAGGGMRDLSATELQDMVQP